MQKHLPDNTPTYKKQTSINLAAFEPTIPASEQRQTYALDGAAAEIGYILLY